MWWVFFAGAVAILTGVMAAALWPFRRSFRPWRVSERAFLGGGGLAFSGAVLFAILVYALVRGEQVFAAPRPDALPVDARGSAWDFAFSFPADDPDPVRLVGEVHVPAGRWVEFRVTSADVIHSFWIPRLGGKVDAIPGRTNAIRLRADEPGVYEGRCAEFCGVGHSGMAYRLVAHPPGEYEAVLGRLRAGDAP